jgi:HEPN domain-containing protein
MNHTIEKLLTNIIKKQNKYLLKEIAKDYELDENYMMNMYNRSTFYKIDKLDDNETYRIIKK